MSAAAGRKRVVVAHQGPDVSAGRIGAFGRAAGLHHMHGLACGSGLISRREEPVGVVQPLGIHHDLLGAIVGGQEPHVVAHGEIDAVAHGEPHGEAEAVAQQMLDQRRHQSAALGYHAETPRGQLVGHGIGGKPGGDPVDAVDDAVGVGSAHRHGCIA